MQKNDSKERESIANSMCKEKSIKVVIAIVLVIHELNTL